MQAQVDDRRSARAKVMLAAKLQCDRAQDVVRILNVSSHGALINADDVPPLRSIISLQIGKTVVEGRICWTNGSYAGVSFTRSVDPRKLVRRISAPEGSPAPSALKGEWRRPGVRGDGLTKGERLYIERLRREGRLPFPSVER